MKKNRLLVISLDAVGGQDLEILKEMPNFKRFLQDACVCDQVESVYPSITYPAHTSIITGRMPAKHGIVNNTLLQPGRKSPDWYWQRQYIKGTTLYDEAVKAGMKVAAILWPVTAKAKIQYNMPEIFANRPWTNQILTSMANGSIRYQAMMNAMFGHLRHGKTQPALDHFSHQVLLYTLSHYQPDLTLCHFTDADTMRHLYGVHSPEAMEALRRHDIRLGEVITLLKNHDLYDSTNIILLGDHYQRDVNRIVYINHLLKKKGYLQTRGNRVLSWKAICKNCDGSAYIYVKDQDVMLARELYAMFNQLKGQKKYGIKAVYSHKEVVRKGGDRGCALMLEADQGYYFLDAWRRLSENVMIDIKDLDGHHMKAVHGYEPEASDYKTFFMACGPDFNKNVHIPSMHLVDEGVTMAELLKLDLGETDGQIIESILKKR